ncbi:MAG: Gfo/Idh/MocA family oxidoreductase [Candidatus Poribacteria bacterium]|nr:Gfo/Idh/MocA family oxidoreductase [Candidatus Poribacteria bacterium]
MNRPNYRVAVIGAGYFSRFHLDAWTRIPDVELVAVCDTDEGKARHAAASHGIPTVHTDYRAMVEAIQPDFVDIITRPDTHLALCADLAERGIHLICQKPLAPTYEESARLVETVSRSDVRFMAHENFRWQPWYREIKRLLDDGTLGEMHSVYFRWRTGDGWGDDAYLERQPYFREYERFLIFEAGVHLLDTFRYLGGEVESVYARLDRRNPIIRGEDAALVVLNFQSGATATFDANRYNECEAENTRYTFGTLRLDGSRGHVELEMDGTLRVKLLGKPSCVHEYARSTLGFGGDCCRALQQHFVDRLRDGQPFESEGEDYLKTLRLVEACYESNERRQVMRID